jgi:hypothetical protein
MKETTSQMKPIARKEGLIIEELPDEVLVYDLDQDRAHCLNQTAAFVWKNCDGLATTQQIADLLGEKLNTSVDENVVWLALDQLDRNNLLTSRPVAPPPPSGMNRRQMVRALGLAAIVAVPVVTSIVAPTPSQAATCLATGSVCTAPAQCCSGLCPGAPSPGVCS